MRRRWEVGRGLEIADEIHIVIVIVIVVVIVIVIVIVVVYIVEWYENDG